MARTEDTSLAEVTERLPQLRRGVARSPSKCGRYARRPRALAQRGVGTWGDQMDRETMPGSPAEPGTSTGPTTTELTPVRGEPSEVNRPIFIVGCHRSGTSVLRRSLDSHPRISSGLEETSLWRLAKDDDDLGRERRAGYGVSEDEWFGMVRSMAETFYLRYAASAGKTRWALKLPENALVIDFLDKLYPDCQVINIVRNPRDVIASNRKKYGPRSDWFYGARWVHYVRTAEKTGPRLGVDRFRTIRYEDLVSDPALVLKDLVEWLGEPWSEEVLKVGGRTHKFPATLKQQEELKEGEVRKADIHTNSVGNGQGDRSFLAVAYVRLKGNDLVKKYGYNIRLRRGGEC